MVFPFFCFFVLLTNKNTLLSSSRGKDGLENEIMLLHLFEMQDRNSTKPSVRLKPRPEQVNNARDSISTLSNYSDGTLNVPNLTGTRASLDFVHKHPEINLLRDQTFSTNLCRTEPVYSSRNNSDNRSNTRHQDLAYIFPFNSHVTKSEPTTRSSSTECEKDLPSNFSVVDIIGQNQDLDKFFGSAVSLDEENVREKDLLSRPQSSQGIISNKSSCNLNNDNILEFEKLFERLELSPTHSTAACIANLR